MGCVASARFTHSPRGGIIMTDVGQRAHVTASRAQLPVSAYFEQSRFERELQALFPQSARYVGNAQRVAEPGRFVALPQEREGRALVHGKNGIELLSNVCRHRQAIMLKGEGQLPGSASTGHNIVCPLHRWTYRDDGALVGAPHFDESPCLNLQRFPLQNWQGLLFEGPRHVAADLASLSARPEFDLSGYVLDSVQMHHCHYNWKTFIEVYLEDYHVGPFHPGLGHFVTCDDLSWEFGDWFSVQRVGVHKALAQPGSEIYQRWHDACLRYNGKVPEFGAVWLTYYPTHMIELYPNTLVLSTLYPVSPQETLNVVEFYYPEDIVHFEREFVEAQQAAYMETAREDDEIAERMDAGRLALFERGTSEAGPYQSPMEDGMQHFHEWYRRVMNEPG
jgi:phenylpropionate dioxygenase-like ring-hydroxylating dioxygenase large terminal subunit